MQLSAGMRPDASFHTFKVNGKVFPKVVKNVCRAYL